MAPIVTEVLGFVDKESAYRNVEVDIKVSEDMPTIESDRGQLQQVLLNLLDGRIAKTEAKRDQLLTVLFYPEVPLHNNESELGARVSARRRDVSLHTRSQAGTRAMDTFTTIVQTAKKLCVNVYAYHALSVVPPPQPRLPS